MIYLTEDKNDKRKDTPRIEAESWGMAEFIARQLGLEVIGSLKFEVEIYTN